MKHKEGMTHKFSILKVHFHPGQHLNSTPAEPTLLAGRCNRLTISAIYASQKLAFDNKQN